MHLVRLQARNLVQYNICTLSNVTSEHLTAWSLCPQGVAVDWWVPAVWPNWSCCCWAKTGLTQSDSAMTIWTWQYLSRSWISNAVFDHCSNWAISYADHLMLDTSPVGCSQAADPKGLHDMRQQLLFCLVILVTPSTALAHKIVWWSSYTRPVKQIIGLPYPCDADRVARGVTRYATCHCKCCCPENALQKYTLPRSSIQCPWLQLQLHNACA